MEESSSIGNPRFIVLSRSQEGDDPQPPIPSFGRRNEQAESLVMNDRENNNSVSSESDDSNPLNSSVQYSVIPSDDDSYQAQSSTSEAVSSNEESNSVASFADVRKADEEPPAKVRRISSPSTMEHVDDGDGETCPICLDSWGNSGDHRLVSLKCGHLFGANCVERWLHSQMSKARTCPTCKSKANVKDIRCLYARKLVAADTSQITGYKIQIAELEKQIEVLQAGKTRMALELQNSMIAHQACALQLEVLRGTLMKNPVSKDQSSRRMWRFALDKNLEISKDGGCRVLTYNNRTSELYVSQKSTNNLFPGFGIRKINALDYKLGQFVHLHTKPIRDITYSHPKDLLLSVGLDSTARILEKGIPNASISCGVPLWSCSWDYLRSHEFYVGGVGGVIHQYDVRNPSTYIQMLNCPGDMSPVVSLCSTKFGLLSCQLNSCRIWVGNMRQLEPRSLPVDGSFMSLCYDEESHRALLSSRGSNNDKSRLTLCKLKTNVISGETLFDIEQTFPGSARSPLMSRSTWVKAEGDSWIASHSESDSSIHLHGLDGMRTLTVPAVEPSLDLCCAQLPKITILAALSDSRLKIYKAVSTNS